MTLFGFLPNLGTGEIILLLIIGILLFGRKLPEVGRYLGKGIVEFKKGIKGIEDDVETSAPAGKIEPQAAESPRPPQKIGVTAPKFEDAPPVAASTPPQI
jgi:sec-independent protein translocase protein TatA